MIEGIYLDKYQLNEFQIQKFIINKGKQLNKSVYVATNLLESMVSNLSPTRAEVNDIYNTLKDGADALVLAAETAIGSTL